jgi:mycothiol synthase
VDEAAPRPGADRGYRIDDLTRLSADQIAAVADLVERVTLHDGLRPLSEHVWLHLKEGGDEQGRHLLALADAPGTPAAGAAGTAAEVVGYAHLDVTDPVDGPSAELAVDPAARRHGLGRTLVEELIRRSPDGRLRLWAHGEQAGAAELATSMGFTHARVLWQMRRLASWSPGRTPPRVMPATPQQAAIAWSAFTGPRSTGAPARTWRTITSRSARSTWWASIRTCAAPASAEPSRWPACTT